MIEDQKMDGSPTERLTVSLKKDGLLLRELGTEDRGNAEIVEEALENNGLALQFASTELRANKDLVVRAIMSDPGAYAFASADLRDDIEVAIKALRVRPELLSHSSSVFQSHKHLMLELVNHNGQILTFIDPPMSNDPDLIATAARSRKRFRARVLDGVGVKKLMAGALAKGYATHADIRENLPAYILSDCELLAIADAVGTMVDVFESTPSESARKSGKIGRRNTAFQKFIEDIFIGLDD